MGKPLSHMGEAEVLAEIGSEPDAGRREKLRRRLRDLEFPPCRTCGNAVHLAGSAACNNCWEVESRLGAYLQSPVGRVRALELLKKGV